MSAKEIKARISSISSTKKITRAMEMIAASKLKKARERMDATKPYAKHIREVIAHTASAHPEYKHPYLEKRPLKKAGFIVIATDRGLCGGLNTNLFKKVIQETQALQQQGVAVSVALIGHKAEPVFKNLGIPVLAYAHHLGEAPKLKDILGAIKVMLDAFSEKHIDSLTLFTNDFVNTIRQVPVALPLLPVNLLQDEDKAVHWDYIYEPDAKHLLNLLLNRYLESQIYQGVVENIACEQAARMLAMKNATDNATDVIHELKLDYNKARQAAITQELAEIVSGTEALN